MPINVASLPAANGISSSWSQRANSERTCLPLNVLPVALPPLRERREDIPVLMEHFLKRYFGAAAKMSRRSPTRCDRLHAL